VIVRAIINHFRLKRKWAISARNANVWLSVRVLGDFTGAGNSSR
jgi:hypothetical protein